MRTFRIPALSALLLSCAVTLPCIAADAPRSPDDWAWSATVYGWFPSIVGTTRFEGLSGGGDIEVARDPDQYLKQLKFAFLGTVEARRGPWSLLVDTVYLNVGSSRAKARSISGPGGNVDVSLDSGSQIGLEAFLGSLAAGYAIVQSPQTHVDVVGGARYLLLRQSLDYHLSSAAGGLARDGSVERAQDLWDGYVGLRGNTALADRWSLRYYVDVGAGSSKLTWQAMGGVAYRYSWGEVLLAYRHLSYDFDKDRVASDLAMSGPLIGAIWRF